MASLDTLDHAHLRDLLQLRVRDGVLLRLIGKWRNAGVLDDGMLSFPEAGTPQGGVVSPLLANVYLHQVLDQWFERDVKPRLKGHAFLIRQADDFVMGFACEGDARRVLEVRPKRFAKYGLTLHPEKTRLVPFRRPSAQSPGGQSPPQAQAGTFDLLGFRHYWGRALKGRWVVKRKTAPERFRQALRRIAPWCRLHRHEPVAEQQRTLGQKLRGHYAYYRVTGNGRALQRLHYAVVRLWRKWLARRHGGGDYPWSRFRALLQRHPLPTPVVVHSVYRQAAKP